MDQSIKEDIQSWIENGQEIEKFKHKLNNTAAGINGEDAFNRSFNIAYSNMGKAELLDCIDLLKKVKKNVSDSDRQRFTEYIAQLEMLFVSPAPNEVEEIKNLVRKKKKDTGYGSRSNSGGRKEDDSQNKQHDDDRRSKEEENRRRSEEEERRRRREEKRREEERRRQQEASADADYEEAKRRQQEEQRKKRGGGNKKKQGPRRPVSRRMRTTLGCLFSVAVIFLMIFIPVWLIPTVKKGLTDFSWGNGMSKKEIVFAYCDTATLFQDKTKYEEQLDFIDSVIDGCHGRERRAWKEKRKEVDSLYVDDLIQRRIGQLFEISKRTKKSEVGKYAKKKNIDNLRDVDSLIKMAESLSPDDERLMEFRQIFDSLMEKYNITFSNP